MFDRDVFLKRFQADEEATLKELKRLRELIKGVEEETFFVFKSRLNSRRNKSLSVKSGSLDVKIEVLTDTSNNRTSQTFTILDAKGYEVAFKRNSNSVRTPKQLAMLMGIDEEHYLRSAKIKAF